MKEINLNNETLVFIEKLKKESTTLGIILFGSWARRNNRPNSDIDLIIIVKNRFQRTVKYEGKQAFEIIYNTKEDALKYWENNLDDAASLWSVAQILYDKTGEVETLQNNISKILNKGKKGMNNDSLKQLHFDAQDQINYVEYIKENDLFSAEFILTNKIFNLTKVYFDIRKIWTPAPKQRLEEIRKLDKELYSLLKSFYTKNSSLDNKIEISRNIIKTIFNI